MELLSVAPAEAVGEGPVDEPAFADEVLFVNVAEDASVGAVELVVAHGEKILRADFEGHIAVEEFGRDAAIVVKDLDGHFVVHVAAIGRTVLRFGHRFQP